ncbi:MAG: hypothetical protein LBI72_05710 [Flavobacteriaceae bacterium]|jgi:hypothetical protein|nr:hypothetical protein [Flavobacteriaceae bacterium]
MIENGCKTAISTGWEDLWFGLQQFILKTINKTTNETKNYFFSMEEVTACARPVRSFGAVVWTD